MAELNWWKFGTSNHSNLEMIFHFKQIREGDHHSTKLKILSGVGEILIGERFKR